jgi:hypothetical protein
MGIVRLRRTGAGTAALAAAAALGLCCAPAWGRPARAGAAATTRISGSVAGLPPSSKKVAVDVRAISMADGSVAAAAVPRHGRFTMTVPRGVYLVVVQVVDLRHRHRGRETVSGLFRAARPRASAKLSLRRRARKRAKGASAPAARTAGVASGAVGIGSIPISAPAGSGIGNTAEGGLIGGLLPKCQANKRRLLDKTRFTDNALEREQKLSDDGRTDVKTHYKAVTPELSVTGSVRVDASGKPLADLTVKNTVTGEVVDHIVTAGSPLEEFWRFLEHLGSGLGSRVCEPKKEAPPAPGGESSAPAPAPTPPGEVTIGPGHVLFTGTYTITYASGLVKTASWSAEGSFSGPTEPEDIATVKTFSGSQTNPSESGCGKLITFSLDSEETKARYSLDATGPYPDPGWRYLVYYPVGINFIETREEPCGTGHGSIAPPGLMEAEIPPSNTVKVKEAKAQFAPLEVAPGETGSVSRPFAYNGPRNKAEGEEVKESMVIDIQFNADF